MTPAEFLFLFVAAAFANAVAYFEFIKSRDALLEIRGGKPGELEKTRPENFQNTSSERVFSAELDGLAGEITLLRARMNSHEFENMGFGKQLEEMEQEIQSMKATYVTQVSRIAVEIEKMKERLGEEAKAFET